MTDGIKDKHRAAIVAAIAANDRVERAVLFGSRATGTNTVTSDVDIALFGDRLTLTDQARLAATLDEIPMAQSVDLLLYDSLQDRSLREHIRNQGIEWFARPMATRSNCVSQSFEASGSWPTMPFSDLVFFQEGPGIRNWQYRTQGVPFVNIRCLVNGRLDVDAMNCLDPREVEEKYRHFLLDEGDYVVSSSGTIGRIAEVCREDLPCMLNTSVIRMRPRDDKMLDRRFLRYFLKSSAFQDQIRSLASGSVQVNYGPTHLKQASILVPSHSEQRSIGHVLGTLDDKIELNRRMNATLEAMARALFRSWFVDFDPVRAKMEGRDTGLPKEIADLFPDRLVDSELGEIPEGWPLVPLPELVEVNPPRKLRKGEAAAYLDMANMPTRGHAPDSVVRRPFGSGMRFANGDTLVARITPCLENGKTAYVDFLRDDEIGWGSTEYIVMRPKHPLPSEFAYLLARSSRFRDFAIQNMSGTSGRQRVPVSSLWGFEVPSPSEPVGVEFGRAVRLLFERARSAVDESRSLTVLRDTLLPKLVSGELRVPAAEPAFTREDRPASVGAHEA